MKTHPTVAIVGRMNVGKSTLFNRLIGTDQSITSSWAGTTRDANRGRVIWRGLEFDLMDTGGLDVEDDEQLEERVIASARRAIAECSVVVFVIDGTVGLLPQDRAIAKELSRSKKPVIVAVNKIDSERKEANVPGNVHSLPFQQSLYISANSGRGTGDLLDLVYEHIGELPDATEPDVRTRVAIVGRPNVGKSSLLNGILGEERVIVADAAHTTRDSNDISFVYKDHPFLLVDTAGIRRQSSVGQRWSDARLGAIEKLSVRQAISAMERADVVLLVLEAQKRVTAQDKKIVSLVEEHGKGLVLVINKWDLIEEKDSNTITQFTKYFDAALPFLRWAPMVFTSATEKLRVRATLDVVLQVATNYERRLTKEELDPIFNVAERVYHPKSGGTRKYKKSDAGLQALEQVDIRPPHFYLKCKRPKDVPRALPSIIERELRDRYDFDGVKLIIEIGT